MELVESAINLWPLAQLGQSALIRLGGNVQQVSLKGGYRLRPTSLPPPLPHLCLIQTLCASKNCKSTESVIFHLNYLLCFIVNTEERGLDNDVGPTDHHWTIMALIYD